MNIGNKEIMRAYIGSQEVDKIYLGEELVYEAPSWTGPWSLNSTKTEMTLTEIPHQMCAYTTPVTVTTNFDASGFGTDTLSMNRDGTTTTTNNSHRSIGFFYGSTTSTSSYTNLNTPKGSLSYPEDNLGYFVTDNNGGIRKLLENYDSNYEFKPKLPANAISYDAVNDQIIIAAGAYDVNPLQSPTTLDNPIVCSNNGGMYTDADHTQFIYFSPLDITRTLMDTTSSNHLSKSTTVQANSSGYYMKNSSWNSGGTVQQIPTTETNINTLYPNNATSIYKCTSSGSYTYWDTGLTVTTKIDLSDVPESFWGYNATYTLRSMTSTNVNGNIWNGRLVITYKDNTSEIFNDTYANVSSSDYNYRLSSEQLAKIPTSLTFGQKGTGSSVGTSGISSYKIGLDLEVTMSEYYSVEFSVDAYDGEIRIGTGGRGCGYFANIGAGGTLESITQTPLYPVSI